MRPSIQYPEGQTSPSLDSSERSAQVARPGSQSGERHHAGRRLSGSSDQVALLYQTVSLFWREVFGSDEVGGDALATP
jgi:hypothetical protein